MDPILGIDLGTTNSEVAVLEDGRPHVLVEDGTALLPSVVGLSEAGGLLVGAPARNQLLLAPDRTVKSIKRQMGSGDKVTLADREFTPQEISAVILRRLKDRATRHLGRSVRKAVITVPAYFNDAQRQATREAGELAGLEVVRILNEPTAAALVYEADVRETRTVLVYDLGGGTFDVSIVEIAEGVVEVRASHGDTQLGGDDFDQLLCDHVADRFQDEHGIDLREQPESRWRLLAAVERAKHDLSVAPYATLREEFVATRAGQPLNLSVELDRHVYEDMIRPLIDRTTDSVQTALRDAGLLAKDLDRIVLVGGSTRTPLVADRLRELTGLEPVGSIDPDLCVTMGAAIEAGAIAGQKAGAVLVDITAHTFGVSYLGEMNGLPYGHCFSPIIHKMTALPASRSKVYFTVQDNQEEVRVEVFQGDDPDALKNTRIGTFNITGLSRVPSGNEIVEHFNLTLDGTLTVTATEKRTGLSKQIVIDTAASRFEQEERASAAHRLNVLFADADEPDELVPVEATVVADEPDDPRAAALGKTVAQARRALGRMTDEDRREAEALIASADELLRDARLDDAEAVREQLDDLLFFLSEA